MAKTALVELPDIEEQPLILECARLIGLTDAALARTIGVTPQAVCNWRARKTSVPMHRKRVIAEIVRHAAGLAAPVDNGNVVTARGKLVRDTVERWLVVIEKEMPRATSHEAMAAESEAYRGLCRLGVKRVDPLSAFDPAGG